MYKIRNTLLAAILLVLTFSGCKKSTIKIPDDFVEYTKSDIDEEPYPAPPPSIFEEFYVYAHNGLLKAKKNNPPYKCELKLPNGLLVGLDRGEFVGSLTYYPNDHSKDTIKIFPDNVNCIQKYKNRIFFIYGYLHGHDNIGALYELISSDSGFKYIKLIDFGVCPYSFAIYNDKLFIAAQNNFFIININDFKCEYRFGEGYPVYMFANSMVVFDYENVFLGTQGGIVKLDLLKKDIRFFEYRGPES